MNAKQNLRTLTLTAVLCAIGIIIPLISPVRITLEPASFTLASHVAIFIAMFLAPSIAVFVSVGTTLGFLIAGFPIVIVFRAATHVIFAFCGAMVLKKKPGVLDSIPSMLLFSFLIACLHGLCEVLVVLPFYFGNSLPPEQYAQSFFVSVVMLVGVGSVIHSMVDFAIAWLVWKPLRRMKMFSKNQGFPARPVS